MRPRSVAIQEQFSFTLPPVRVGVMLLVAVGLGVATAVYWGISREIGRPCADCYLAAFGQPLARYGHPNAEPAGIVKPVTATAASDMPAEPAPRPSGGGAIQQSRGNVVATWVFWSAAPDISTTLGVTSGQPGETDLSYDRVAPRDWFNQSDRLPVGMTPWAGDFIPHGRVAVWKDLERHFSQIGTTGIDATDQPAAAPTPRESPEFPNRTSVIDEPAALGGGFSLLGVDGFNALDTFRAGMPYQFIGTVTPPVQSFHLAGPADAARYFFPDVRPNSAGVVAGVAYTPWEQPSSSMRFLNLRIAAQYATSKEISGILHGPGGTNTLVLSLWGALRF